MTANSTDEVTAENRLPGPLDGLRVVELADETAEYCGCLLAGLGADVIKVEPFEGAASRRIGPFVGEAADAERSLHFWHYNRGKRSISHEALKEDGTVGLGELLDGADVVLESGSPGSLPLGNARDEYLRSRNPGLVIARLTPFGESGPWADYLASDLVQLALGGVMKNCGYDPEPDGYYDLPPIAPQAWQSCHIAGEQLLIGILAALRYRNFTGKGQTVSMSIHQAVSANIELDTMFWVMRRAELHRLTCRHASESTTGIPTIGATKDGRWVMCFVRGRQDERLVAEFLEKHDSLPVSSDVISAAAAPASHIPGAEVMAESTARMTELGQRFVRRFTYQRVPWKEAQDAGLLMVPLRLPHENLADEHWGDRGTYAEIDHGALGRLKYPVSKWLSDRNAWQVGCRAPHLNEHKGQTWRSAPRLAARVTTGASDRPRDVKLPLSGVRILDFGWFLATAGGSKFLASLGAECIKVEWWQHPDSRNAAMAPVGGRAARDAATSTLPGVEDLNQGGQFNNKNCGKRGLSLNVRHPRGLEIARQLVAISDVVAEGFTPGVMDRWGLGYEALRALKPDIIFAQQSGFGTRGRYGRYRMFGPTAASFTGLSELSGLPQPAMPSGWGYSYLDWIAAYTFAQAVLSALLVRDRTGLGQHIDASQCESGLFLPGATLLDWQVNGRAFERVGNSPQYKPAAPQGVYRAKGVDQWLALTCFNDEQWHSLAQVADRPEWLSDPRFASLRSRQDHFAALDALIEDWSRGIDAKWAFAALQAAGVPAGMCQNAEDRIDDDPQLAELGWLHELEGSAIGRWPVVDIPFRLSASPADVGGPTNRGAPIYGEDNAYVLGELLGMPESEIAQLESEGAI